MADYKKITGFADMFGDKSSVFTMMENKAREVFHNYVFEELRTPILEYTELFQRSIGDATDVVQKEMFTFPDRKGRLLTLRPEATAGVMRALIEEGFDKGDNIARFYTIGPMFRYERPQKGRMRQFHQINCECIGSDSPYIDAEMVCMLLEFLKGLRIENLQLKINSLGCKNCRGSYLEALKTFLHSRPVNEFCEDCQTRIEKNPMRVLDCKKPSCKNMLAGAPRIIDHICGECAAHWTKFLELLALRNIKYEIDSNLVRGLDYYTRTTFEVVSDQIGAQTAVAGGGRYDGLIAQLGGREIPGIGFACGMERLALLLPTAPEKGIDFYLLCARPEFRDNAFELMEKLRTGGFSGEMNYRDASFKSLLRHASKLNAAYVLILGENEFRDQAITIKDMAGGGQCVIPQKEVLDKLAQLKNKAQ